MRPKDNAFCSRLPTRALETTAMVLEEKPCMILNQSTDIK